MAGFSEAWDKINVSRSGQPVSPELKTLLHPIYLGLVSDRPQYRKIKASLEALLNFLASPQGCTNANCWAAGFFFCKCDGWESQWPDAPGLPQPLSEVVASIGKGLHLTIAYPDAARGLDCLPEQLIERLNRVEVG